MEWMRDALCREIDPDLFFPDDGKFKAAKEVCAACSVFDKCYEYAEEVERNIPSRDWWGIWAGEAAKERIRRRRQQWRQVA